MSISTKGVKKNHISKELKPGNVVAKINNLSIEQVKTPKDPKNPEYKIFIELESRPIGGDFVGFDKVFGDASKGQHLGQTKKIQFSNWPIRTSEGISKKTGKAYKILASAKILEFVQKLLTIVGGDAWLEANDGKFDTWEQLLAGVVRSGLLKDKYFSWCIGATEGQNAAGYTVYYMWLPEKKDAAEPFALEGGLVTKFDANIHITKSKSVTENAALNDGVDDDDSVAREQEDDDFANAPTDSPFDNDELDDSELFDMDED
jgi:hypothetical protein